MLACFAAACGGAAVSDPSSAELAGAGGVDDGATGGAAATTASGGRASAGAPGSGGLTAQAGAGGSFGSGGATSAGGSAPCVPKDPNAYPGACSDLERLRVVDPVIADDSGDGRVSPGESITLTVTLEDTSGYGFYLYPFVAFEGSVGLNVADSSIFYAIAQCGSMPTSVRIDVSPYVTPGQTVTVTARPAALNSDCSGPSIEIPITIGPYL